MKAYRVYHKKKNYKAVPMGFSLGAFLASALWAAANNLWGKSLLLTLGFIIFAGAVVAGTQLNFEFLSLVSLVGFVMLPLWAGLKGQSWICSSLEKQGYKIVARLTSKSASEALATAKEIHNKTSQIKEAQQQQKEKAQKQPSFSQDFRHIRDGGASAADELPEFDDVPPWRKNRQ